MRETFSERATQMGLNSELAFKGLYKYSDRYSEVVYRQTYTMPSQITDESHHETDNYQIPAIAIFTKAPDQVGYLFCGCVSEIYQFIGNDVLNERIRRAIQQVGMPILTENVISNYINTRMRTEMIIQSSQSVPCAGDILPVMIVNNSYDGSKAATVAFGIATTVNSQQVTFSFSLGEMRQVHIENSNVEMASAVSSYMEAFSGGILELITNSFNSTLTVDQMFGTFDIIEKLGKRRKEEISKILAEMNPVAEGEEPPLPSAWHMFLAIVRYSSFEPNLSIKKMLENAAESVLVIPTRMYNVLERLQAS